MRKSLKKRQSRPTVDVVVTVAGTVVVAVVSTVLTEVRDLVMVLILDLVTNLTTDFVTLPVTVIVFSQCRLKSLLVADKVGQLQKDVVRRLCDITPSGIRHGLALPLIPPHHVLRDDSSIRYLRDEG